MSGPYAAPVELKAQALSRCGVDPITSESQPGRRTTILNAAYEPKVREMLEAHCWKFATAWTPLVYQEERAYGQWRYAYDEPEPDPPKLINRGVFLANPTSSYNDLTRAIPIPHDVANGTILTNCKYENQELVLKYGFRATEGDWTAKFSEAVVLALQSIVYASPIKNDPALAREFDQKAVLQLGRAAQTDAEQVTRDRQRSGGEIVEAWSYGYRRR